MDRVRAVALDQRGVAWVDARGRVTARMPVDAFDGEGHHLRDRGPARRPRGRPARRHPRTRRVRLRRHRRRPAPGRRRRRRHVRERAAAAVRARHRGRRALLAGPTAGLRRGSRACTRSAARWPGSARPPSRPRRLVPHAQRARRAGRFAAARPARPASDQGRDWACGWTRAPTCPATSTASARCCAAPSRAWAGRRRCCVDAMATAAGLRVHGRRARCACRGGRGAGWRCVGDAAACPTPLTGLGTSVALVQAYVLAGELRRAARGDHQRGVRPLRGGGAALRRAPRSSYRPAASTATPRAARLAIRLRTASMRAMTQWPMRPILERQFAKAGDIALPDYATCQAG